MTKWLVGLTYNSRVMKFYLNPGVTTVLTQLCETITVSISFCWKLHVACDGWINNVLPSVLCRQWNSVNTATDVPEKFGHINGVVVLKG